MGLIETAKDLAALVQKLDNVEIIQKVLALQSEMLSVQDQVQHLRSENLELKSLHKIDDELELRENAYWRDSARESRRGPFCKRCWDVDKKLVNLNVSEEGYQQCPQCEQAFETSRFRAAMRSDSYDPVADESLWIQD